MKKLIIAFAVISCLALAPKLEAQTEDINHLVDSLFIVASSGELKYRDKVEPAKAKLAELGPEAVPRLISKLTTPDARERLTVIRILKSIGKPAVPLLSKSLQTLKSSIQLKRICWALGDIGSEAKGATDELIVACDNDNWQVREYALRALGKILSNSPTDVAVNIVSQKMADPIGQTRKSAVWAAGQFHDLSLTHNLIISLSDSYYGARLNAATSLVKIATDSSVAIGNAENIIAALREFTSANTSAAGDLACETLGRIGAKLPDSLNSKVVSILSKQLRSNRELRRGAAVRALGECAPADEWGILINLRLTEPSLYVIQSIDSAIARIEVSE